MNKLPEIYPWFTQAWKLLDQASQKHHALLVNGKKHCGLFEFLHAFAISRLCRNRLNGLPCASCKGCRLALEQNHPDLILCLPLALLQERELLYPELWTSGTSSSSSQYIVADQVRWVLEWAIQTPHQDGKKIVVIYPMERLNTVSANTLLKLLEEPPESLQFVLGTYRHDLLLPTILSRCHSLHVPLPSLDQIKAFPPAEFNEKDLSLESLAQWSRNQPLALQENANTLRWTQLWLRKHRDLALSLKQATELPIIQLLTALERIAHDALRLFVGANALFLQGEDAARLKQLPLQNLKLAQFQKNLAQYWRKCEHPLNHRLLAESIMLEFHDCFEEERN